MSNSNSESETARTKREETYECVSILEYNENAPKYREEAEPGDRVIVGGVQRNTNIHDEEVEGFVEIAEAVAIFELYQPLTDGELNEWCNSNAGKLALAHWFDHFDPEDVVMET